MRFFSVWIVYIGVITFAGAQTSPPPPAATASTNVATQATATNQPETAILQKMSEKIDKLEAKIGPATSLRSVVQQLPADVRTEETNGRKFRDSASQPSGSATDIDDVMYVEKSILAHHRQLKVSGGVVASNRRQYGLIARLTGQ